MHVSFSMDTKSILIIFYLRRSSCVGDKDATKDTTLLVAAANSRYCAFTIHKFLYSFLLFSFLACSFALHHFFPIPFPIYFSFPSLPIFFLCCAFTNLYFSTHLLFLLGKGCFRRALAREMSFLHLLNSKRQNTKMEITSFEAMEMGCMIMVGARRLGIRNRQA